MVSSARPPLSLLPEEEPPNINHAQTGGAESRQQKGVTSPGRHTAPDLSSTLEKLVCWLWLLWPDWAASASVGLGSVETLGAVVDEGVSEWKERGLPS